MLKKETLKEMVKRIIKEESTQSSLTINVGGQRYSIKNSGLINRLGSEEMDYGNDFKLVGATSTYGGGNRRFTKNDIELSLNDIFTNPDSLVGKYPLVSSNGKIDMLLGSRDQGNKESNYRVLWVK